MNALPFNEIQSAPPLFVRVGAVLPKVPASFFGMVLGLGGLGFSWRAAQQVWPVPGEIGEALMAVAALVWAVLILLYGLKWLFARNEALAEAMHPIQCCFIGLAGVATMIIAGGALPYSRIAAEILFGLGAAFTAGFAVWRTGLLWQGNRDHAATTPVLYLPTVAGGFVLATVSSALGYPDWGQLAFGVAFFSWLAIESVLLHRLYTQPTKIPALRPTLGIQLAPPAVGAVAYLSVGGGAPDIVVHAMIGYALLQAVLLLRLLPWILEQPFGASYWAFTFGATALATAPLRLVAHGDKGPVAVLAPWLFGGANITVGLIAIGTLYLLLRGRLLPKPAPAAK
jgi:tellurite resistance protein